MPHFWNDIVVVTKEELAPWYNTEALNKTIARYKNKSYGIKRVQRACLNQPMLISFDSLPVEIQQTLGDPRQCNHILERYYKEDGGAVRWFKTFRFDDGKRLELGPMERYIINASVMEAVKKLKADRERERRGKGIGLVGIYTTLWKDAMSFQETLRIKYNVQHTLQESERRFIEAFKAYEEDGFASLIKGTHGNQNSRKVTDEVLRLLNDIFAGDKTKPTATDVHRRYNAFVDGYVTVVNNDTAEVYDRTQFKKLSDATVKNYLTKWENKIGTYANRSTDREKLITQFKPSHSLSKPKFAGSILSIDDRQPPFKDLSGNRPWFYMGIDLGSECFTCAVSGSDKKGIIVDFYRQLVRNYAYWGINLPYELECEMSLNSSFKDTFLRDGEMFQKVRIEANNPRGKRIERYFRTLRYEYEKDREGWLARPHARSENNQAAVDLEKVPQIEHSKIVMGCVADMELWNSRKHSVHTHLTRWEVFMQRQHPDIPATNYIGILPYIGYKTKTSCNVGQIRLNNAWFLLGDNGKIALGANLISLMKQVEGQELQVYWLDDYEGNVLKAMVYSDGNYICEAIAKPVYNRATLEQTDEDKLNRSLMSAYEATITAFGKRQQRQIETVTIISNQQPEVRVMTMPGFNKPEKQLNKATGGLLPSVEYQEEETLTPSFTKRALKDRL